MMFFPQSQGLPSPETSSTRTAFSETSSRTAKAKISVLKLFQHSNLKDIDSTITLMRRMNESGDFRFRVASPRPFGNGKNRLDEVDVICRDFGCNGRFDWRNFRIFSAHVRALAEETEHIWITGPCARSLTAVRNLPHNKILHQNNNHFQDRISMLKWFGFYHGLSRQLDAITFPNDFIRNEALTIAPWLQARSHVVRDLRSPSFPNLKDHKAEKIRAREKLKLSQDKFLIGNSLSRSVDNRIDVFLETASLVKKMIPNASFVIFSEKPLEEQWKHQAIRLDLVDSCKFINSLPDPSLHYRSLDVCLHATDFDPLGRSLLDALSEGCLVVASVPCGCVEELIYTNKNGVLLDHHNSDRLSREIVTLYRDPCKAKDLREAAFSHIYSQHSVDQAFEFHQSIFS